MAKGQTSSANGKNAISLELGKLYPKQTEFYNSKALYTAYGGARGPGKTHACRITAIDGALRYKDIRILMIRRTYPDLQNGIIDPILKILGPLISVGVVSYNGANHVLKFNNNGSTIRFGHFSGMASESEYRGQEYDWIFIDEATQFTEQEFRILGGCLRGVNNIPKRFFLTCNPGGVGHRWVKRLFVDKKYKTDCENPEENENPDDYNFIAAMVEDNPALLASSPTYLAQLMALPENMRNAHRYGDWSALAGTYFPEFSEAKHVIAPFKIPDHWVRYRAFDYGLDALAVGWFAQDENGRSYMYRELKLSNLIVSDAAKLIRDNTGVGEQIAITFAPPDMWNRQKDTGKTMAEVYMLNGIYIVKADNNRVQGWLQVKEALAPAPDFDEQKKLLPEKEWRPGLLIFNNCKETIGDIQAIQADEKNPNDCAKEPHEITHLPDMLRYYCVSRMLKTEPVASQEVDYDDEQLEDYEDFMCGGEATASYLNY